MINVLYVEGIQVMLYTWDKHICVPDLGKHTVSSGIRSSMSVYIGRGMVGGRESKCPPPTFQ